ncbi:MAG: MFS transporter [Legionellaceae bacterium]|nr:MFS transporter [Legionellaceae bacterium]
MPSSWGRTVFPIALIFSFRMLGLFMLIPVFSVLALQLEQATPVLIGIALGAYGLSQGILQIPFGMLSDRYGRKPIISIGLILFALGSLAGALSTSIYGMIFARTLQGMGAIGSVLIALSADLTADEHRTKGMALIGMTIGLSFALAMMIGPPLARFFGLAGIFYFSIMLAACGLLLLWLVIPNPTREIFHADSETQTGLLLDVIRKPALLQLNASIFLQHLLLTTTFFAVPIILHRPLADGTMIQTWYFYLPVMLIAFLLMVPLIILAEKRQHMKRVMQGAILATLLAQLLLGYYSNLFICFSLLMTLYFTGFNVLEACLPSLISKHAPVKNKGSAMGVYSSCQFLGIFAGGFLAGILYKYYDTQGIFYANALLCLLWLAILFRFEPLAYFSTTILPLPSATDPEILRQELLAITGVKDVYIAPEEQVIYIKFNKQQWQQADVLALLQKRAGKTAP